VNKNEIIERTLKVIRPRLDEHEEPHSEERDYEEIVIAELQKRLFLGYRNRRANNLFVHVFAEDAPEQFAFGRGLLPLHGLGRSGVSWLS
jgi:hypothetical protein